MRKIFLVLLMATLAYSVPQSYKPAEARTLFETLFPQAAERRRKRAEERRRRALLRQRQLRPVRKVAKVKKPKYYTAKREP